MEANLELLQGGVEMLLLLLLIVLIIMILVIINIILLLMMIILKHGFTDDYEYASHENATAAADPEQMHVDDSNQDMINNHHPNGHQSHNCQSPAYKLLGKHGMTTGFNQQDQQKQQQHQH